MENIHYQVPRIETQRTIRRERNKNLLTRLHKALGGIRFCLLALLASLEFSCVPSMSSHNSHPDGNSNGDESSLASNGGSDDGGGDRQVLPTEQPNPCFVPPLYDEIPHPAFEDVAEQFGFTHLQNSWNYPAQGVCIFDFNQDNALDVFFVTSVGGLLYQNNGTGHFSVVQTPYPLANPRQAAGCGILDYDNDGDMDLVTVGRNAVRLNSNRGKEGNFAFEDVTDRVGLFSRGMHFSVAAASIDDGPYLSLALANDGDGRSGGDMRDSLFIYDPSTGHYSEEGAERGMQGEYGSGRPSFVNAFLDVDEDGDQDYLARFDNGMNVRDEVYLNDGTGHFIENAEALGLACSPNQPPFPCHSADTMGIAFGDYNLDGLIDVAETNYHGSIGGTDLLYEARRRGDGRLFYEEVARGVDFPGRWQTTWGNGFGDFDFDGDPDYYAMVQSSGPCEEEPCAPAYPLRPNFAFNVGGRFEEYEPRAGKDFFSTGATWGGATGDLDGDMIPEIVGVVQPTTPGQSKPPLVARITNEMRAVSGNALGVRLTCTTSNTQCIGARVRVEGPGDCTQTQVLTAGGGFASMEYGPLTFGLGEETEALVTIVWPNGEIEEVGTRVAGEIHTIIEPQ